MKPELTDQRIANIRQQIREIEASLPAHSIPPSMLIRLEELEDQLAELLAQSDHE